jgi:large repetitive protein
MAVSVTIQPVDGGNNYINAANEAAGITISGTVTDSVMADVIGQTVTLTLNGANYTGVVGSTGTWQVTVPSSALTALTNGAAYTASATVTDTLGKKGTGTDTVTVDTTASLTINSIDGNGYINGTNAAAGGGIKISGTSTGGLGSSDFAGKTVTVTLNGASYTGTIGGGGAWSVTVPKAAVDALTDASTYSVTASAADKAVNPASTSASVTTDEKATLSISEVDGNNYINAANTAAGITISGSTTDSILANLVGKTVTVTLNGALYTGTVQSDGSWLVNVGAAALAGLTNETNYAVKASVTDAAGNTATFTDTVKTDTTASITITSIDANGFINGKNAAAAGGIKISGTSTGGLGSGDFGTEIITVTLNGVSYNTTVGGGGTWSVTVPKAAVDALADATTYTVTASATDKAGNPASTSASVTTDESATLSINEVDGNNYVNAANAAAGITISGSTTDSILSNIAGKTVTLTLGGVTYTPTVQSNGSWSVNLGTAALAALTNGTAYPLKATVTDAAGNTATATDTVTVDTTASIAIKSIDGNGFINAANAAAAGGITISGTSTGGVGGDFSGKIIMVTLNGVNYSATIGGGGAWSVTVPKTAVDALTNGATYAVSASATDKAGNSASASGSVTIDETVGLTINAVDGNNYINGGNVATGITITGTATDSVLSSIIGKTVTVTLNGVSYTGTVASAGTDGTWSVGVGSAALAALTNGNSYTVKATLTDAAGNTATVTDTVKVDEPAITISPIDGDNVINGANEAAGITISGTVTNKSLVGLIGQTVDVTLNGKTYTGVVAAGGAWSVAVTSANLAGLTDGNIYPVTASVTDKAGTPATTTDNVTVDEQAGLTIDPIDGNNYINGANEAAGITISGTASDSVNSSIVGQTVTVEFNGNAYTGTVEADDSWSVTVGASALAGLADATSYAVSASVTDKVNNSASADDTVTTDESATLTVDPIDASDLSDGLTMSGTATDSIPANIVGQDVTVTLDGQTYKTPITADPVWTLTIPGTDLSDLVPGQTYPLDASATDLAGNTASAEADVTVPLPLAEATITNNPIDFGNVRVGDAVTDNIDVENSATPPAQTLDGNVAGSTGDVTASGSFTGLSAGGPADTTDLSVTLDTSSDGPKTGTVTVDFASDNGTTTTPLASQTVDATGTVWNEASGSISAPSDEIFHVGDSGALPLTVENTAPADGYSEGLVASATGSLGDVTGAGTSGVIAAGSSDDSSLTATFDTSTAGTYSGDVAVDLQTDGAGTSGLAPLDLGTTTVPVSATVNNYANPVFETPDGVLTQSGDSYTLDLGEVYQGDDPLIANLSVLNDVTDPADDVSSNFTASGDPDFTNSLTDFTDLAPGATASGDSVELSTDSTGTFSETIDLGAVGSNASGYSAALPDETLTITGEVLPSPPPYTPPSPPAPVSPQPPYTPPPVSPPPPVPPVTPGPAQPTVSPPSPIDLGTLRVGEDGTQPLTISNTAPDGSDALNVLIGGTSGDATADGSISNLVPGDTDDSSITVGVDTSTAGNKSGTVTLDMSSSSPGLQTQTDTLDFSTSGQSMWASGAAGSFTSNYTLFSFDKSGSGSTSIGPVDLSGSYAASGSLTNSFSASSGSVDVDYPLNVSTQIPDQITPGQEFTVQTDAAGLGSATLNATIPSLSDAVTLTVNGDASLAGEALGYGATFTTGPLTYTNTQNIDPSHSWDLSVGGVPGSLSFALPSSYSSMNTTTGSGDLPALTWTGQTPNVFSGTVDLAQVAFALAESEIGDAVPPSGDFSKGPISGSYNIVSLPLTLGIALGQQLVFQPTGIDETITPSWGGSAQTGPLGTAFDFTAPDDASGSLSLTASYSITGNLDDQLGVLGTADISISALGATINGTTLGPLLPTTSLASGSTGTGYFYDTSPFELQGFSDQSETYNIPVQAADTGSGGGASSGSTTPLSPPVSVDVQAVVDNYAVITPQSDGDLSGSGDSWVLDLGTASVGDPDLMANLSVLNGADPSLPADLLDGNYSISGDPEYSNSGFGPFTGIAAGSSDTGGEIDLSTASPGTFEETITVAGQSTNSSEPPASLDPVTIEVEGTISPPPPPSAPPPPSPPSPPPPPSSCPGVVVTPAMEVVMLT